MPRNMTIAPGEYFVGMQWLDYKQLAQKFSMLEPELQEIGERFLIALRIDVRRLVTCSGRHTTKVRQYYKDLLLLFEMDPDGRRVFTRPILSSMASGALIVEIDEARLELTPRWVDKQSTLLATQLLRGGVLFRLGLDWNLFPELVTSALSELCPGEGEAEEANVRTIYLLQRRVWPDDELQMPTHLPDLSLSERESVMLFRKYSGKARQKK